MKPVDWVLIGLAVDVTGAFALARSFMLKHANDARVEATTYYGFNRWLLKSLLVQRAEAWAGFTLLVLGFSLQMWGNFHGAVAASELGVINSGSRLVVAFAATVLLSFVYLRAWQAHGERTFWRAVLPDMLPPERGVFRATPDDPGRLDRLARLFRTQRLSGEQDEALSARLERLAGEKYARYGPKGGTR